MRVELEVLHVAVLQDNEFDILTAHVDDHMWVVIELERGFGVCDRLNQCHIGVENITQDTLRISRGAHSKNFKRCTWTFNLLAQLGEHVNGVLNGIAVGELIRLTRMSPFSCKTASSTSTKPRTIEPSAKGAGMKRFFR